MSWEGADQSPIKSYDVQVSTDGGGWVTWLTRTTARSEVWLGRQGHGYAFRVRARDSKGYTSAWNVTATWKHDPEARQGRLRQGRRRRSGLPRRPRHERPGHRVARCGHRGGHHRRSDLRRRLHLVRGQPADPRMGPGVIRREGRLGTRKLLDAGPDRYRAGAQRHHRRRRHRRHGLRRRERPDRRIDRGARCPLVLARCGRLGGPASPPLDEPRRPRQPDAPGLPDRRFARRQPFRAPAGAPVPGPGIGTGRSAARRSCPTAAMSCSSWARPAASRTVRPRRAR